jgi:MFS family permease
MTDDTMPGAGETTGVVPSTGSARSGLVLIALILVVAVANLNLVVLSVPVCILAAWALSVEVLAPARVLGGLSAGMAYPTTLALITACGRDRPVPDRSPCGPASVGRSRRSACSSPVRCSTTSGGARCS